MPVVFSVLLRLADIEISLLYYLTCKPPCTTAWQCHFLPVRLVHQFPRPQPIGFCCQSSLPLRKRLMWQGEGYIYLSLITQGALKRIASRDPQAVLHLPVPVPWLAVKHCLPINQIPTNSPSLLLFTSYDQSALRAYTGYLTLNNMKPLCYVCRNLDFHCPLDGPRQQNIGWPCVFARRVSNFDDSADQGCSTCWILASIGRSLDCSSETQTKFYVFLYANDGPQLSRVEGNDVQPFYLYVPKGNSYCQYQHTRTHLLGFQSTC